MKKKIRRSILFSVLVVSGVLFVIRFGGPSILRMYIGTAIGNCQKIPVLCIVPQEEIIPSEVSQEYIDSLLTYKLPEIQVKLPKGFTVIKQRITKVYYKKWRRRTKGAVVYLLYEPKDFFVRLFPQFKKYGINNDYDFISHVMNARVDDINNVVDAFFVVMKGIFIPDLADQHNVKIARFSAPAQRGFIGYNTTDKEHYFNCDILTEEGYYKVYIKDKAGVLDLAKVTAILSTIKKLPVEAAAPGNP